MTWEDPIVAEVRRIREELAARFNFDLAAIFADIRSRQEGAGDRLVRLKGQQQAEHVIVPPAAAASETSVGSEAPPV